MSFLSKFKDRFRSAIPDRRVEKEHFEDLRDFIGAQNSEIFSRLDDLSEKLSEIKTISTKNFDRVFDLRRDLLNVRKTKEYAQLFEEDNPLVSVRIATWNNAELLVDRAIKSVQAQTYNNWELIVVGDGCEDDTEKRIKSLNDDRITFYNFPYRNVYPEDPINRWQVAGIPGMNKGAELAKGSWIAPLDDDDEFSEDHIEVLLKKALDGQFEFVYGDTKYVILTDGRTGTLTSYPPEKGGISNQSYIYPKILDFFEMDANCWAINEPGDWNFIRRMMESGVRIGKVDEIVATIYNTPPELKSK